MDSLLHGLTWFHRRSSNLSGETTRFAFRPGGLLQFSDENCRIFQIETF